MITHYPQYKEFRLKVFKLNGKKGSDRGGMNVLPFSFEELEKGEPTNNRKLILLFTGSEKWNDFGVIYKEFAFKMLDVKEWNEILLNYSQLNSPIEEDINDFLIPVFSLISSTSSTKLVDEKDVITIKTVVGGKKVKVLEVEKKYKREDNKSFVEFRDLHVSAKGLKKDGKIIYPFYNLRGDDYLISDFSDQYKIVANEKSMGLYIKGAEESILIQRRLINKIHSFLNDLAIEEDEDED